MRKSHRHALRGREAILAVQNHAVAAIEQYNGGAGTLILTLMHCQVAILQIDGDFDSLPLYCVRQRRADVEVKHIAEFIRARNSARLDPRREIARVVPAETASSERAEQVSQSLEAQKVDRFVGNLETRFRIPLLWLAKPASRRLVGRWSHLRWLLRVDESFLRKTFDELLDEVSDLLLIQC